MDIRVRDAVAKRFPGGPLSRRAALRRLGAGGLAAGLLTSLAARSSQSQEWETATPAAGGASSPGADHPLTGVTGGLPPFAFQLEASQPRQFATGDLRLAFKQQFATLQGVAMASERIDPGGMRELHWHLNAHELSYCLAGQGRMGIFSTDGTGSTFDIQPGSISFVPNGYTHFIQNTGSDVLHIVLTFTHEQPQTTDLSQALPSFPAQVLAQTFGVSTADFPFLATGDRSFVAVTSVTPAAPAPSPFTVHADQVAASEFAGGGGTVRAVGVNDIPSLEGITVFPLHAVPHGLREPHWHPNTTELSYCVSGRAQIGLVAPDGNVQTFAVEPGTIALIPDNWFHYIANVSDDPLELLVFFVNAEAKAPHIDLSQTFEYFPPEVLAASFGIDPAQFASLPSRGDVFLAAPVDAD